MDFGGIRYACAKLEISSYRPVRYEMAMQGDEHFSAEYEEGDIFGFPVDTGMACLVDLAAGIATTVIGKSAGMRQEERELIPMVISISIS